ncbi:MAG: hypothetical protein P9L94_02610 [Candidatus Hinthialibacter antarcticus]|nr:hypothetical protein [Candidatus Hinthialibacter antarcticus]
MMRFIFIGAITICVSLVSFAEIIKSQVETRPLDVILDGSSFFPFFEMEDSVRFSKTEIEFQLNNSQNVKRVSGVITHPFGDGPFSLRESLSNLIENASVNSTIDKIYFHITFKENAKFALKSIFFKPQPGVDLEANNVIHRKRAFSTTYPHQVLMDELRIEDAHGNELAFNLFTNPLLYASDIGGLVIQYENFPKSIKTSHVIAINNVPLYPPIIVSPGVNNQSHKTLALIGFDSDPLPLTFKVVLIDGTEYIIEHPNGYSLITVSPSSQAAHWREY